MNDSNKFEIVGIGNAVVDLLSNVDDNFLIKNSLEKSTMTLVEKDYQKSLVEQVEGLEKVAGGSAANSLRTIGMLGLNCGFIGAVSDDDAGLFFLKSMLESNVEFLLKPINSSVPTGTCAIFVTPDSERTMRTHMGASDLISDDNLASIEPSVMSMFFVEGYQFDTKQHKEAIKSLATKVKKAGGKVALTVSDVFCIKDHHEDFLDFLNIVDIVFCNEKEFEYLFSTKVTPSVEKLVAEVRSHTDALCIVTRSEKGALVIDHTNFIEVKAVKADSLRDATGAGDQFAAGFLYGYCKEYSFEDCAKFGAELATAVISKIGPFLTESEVAIAKDRWLTRI